jgi:hypothetical protein
VSSCPCQGSPSSTAFFSFLAILYLMSSSLSKPTCISHWSHEIHFYHLPPRMENSIYKASHSFTLFHVLTLAGLLPWPVPLLSYLAYSACLAYSLTLKMEPVCSSKILVNFYQTMQHHIPEGSVLFTVTTVRISNYMCKIIVYRLQIAVQ